MNTLKRLMGVVCMLIGPAIVVMLMLGAIHNIDAAGKSEINKPVPWVIIISIFIPVALGLMIFGWYAWKGEYDKLAERSEGFQN